MKAQFINSFRTGNKKRVTFIDVNGKTCIKDFDAKMTDAKIKKALGVPVPKESE